MGRGDYYDYYLPSKPREVQGGIKAQGKGNSLSKNWWAKRWNQVLESFGPGSRLTRGRSYAKSGQVLSVDIKSGKVVASVQGSRVKPYKVTINVKVLSAAEWDRVMGILSGEAIFAARLLAGEMPPEIEKVFAQAGMSLFPERGNDLETDCSCPDWSNPCKHIAAVYYILGQEFDRDPFLLFKLRGLEREEMMAKLAGAGVADRMPRESAGAGIDRESQEDRPVAGSADPVAFWEGGALPEDFLTGMDIPPVRATLLKQLGEFPFWRGEESILKALEPRYKKAPEAGLRLVAGVMDGDEYL